MVRTEGHRDNVDKGTMDTYSNQSINQSIEQSVFILHKLHTFYNNYRFIRVFMGRRAGPMVRALASHRCGSGSILISDHMWAKFVVSFFSAPRGFFSRNARALNT